MKRIVVDASVAVKWFVPEEYTDKALQLLDDQFELLAPDLLFLEVAGVMWQRVQSKRMSMHEAGNVIPALRAMKIGVVSVEQLLDQTLSIALKTGQTVYDSTYLALVVREGISFVTADKKLISGIGNAPLAKSLVWLPDL